MENTTIAASPLDITVMPLPEDMRTALALYEAPFRYSRGYILDAKNNMVADDDGQDVALRVRGWGRISYMPEPETLQDTVGALMAQALTEFWARHNDRGQRGAACGASAAPTGCASNGSTE